MADTHANNTLALSRRSFIHATGAAAATGLIIMSSHTRAFADHHLAGEGVIGHNGFKYKVVPNWGKLDANTNPVKDCHAMVQDSKGRIILLTNNTKNNIIVYDKSGKLLETWGETYPGAHGMSIVNENGEDFLWITDHDRHQVYKVTMDGREVMTLDYPKESGVYDSPLRYKPTWAAVAPNGDIYVFDGYGLNYVMQYDSKGELIRTFGGRGNEPEKFSTPHGGIVDTRDPNNPVLIVASREQHALKRFTLNAEYIDTIPVPGARVCTLFQHGSEMYIPVLNGWVAVMDANNKIVSCPGGTEPIYDPATGRLGELSQADQTFIHPHGIMVDDEGDVYVPQWNSEQTYPVKLERV